jgi:hypothetical protein
MVEDRMMEGNTVYVWASIPGEWTCYAPSTGFVTVGSTRAEALDRFGALNNQRSVYHIVEGAPARAGAQADRAGDGARTIALAACHARWTQRLEVCARDGMVELLSAAAALDELLELATK